MKKHYLTAFAVASVVISASATFAATETTQSVAMRQLRVDHPNLLTMDREGKVHKLLDKELASGRSPIDTAMNFISSWSTGLGVRSDQFIERGPFPDGHSTQQLMYNPETGEHKFTGVYFMQTADGLPVYESRLMVLVRNADGFPAVSATTVLQDVAGFKRTNKFAANNAVALMSAAVRLGRGVTISEPELMVFARTEKDSAQPTEALVFEATYGGGWDFDN
ncbi:hypothetical protein H8D29_06400, partial [PVC group bacterium]|nr:hypothetical protein [PVC group bacterium]